MQEDYMTWKCKSIREKMQNKKNIENKKIGAGVKFDARWDDKLKFFLRCLISLIIYLFVSNPMDSIQSRMLNFLERRLEKSMLFTVHTFL